MTEFILCPARVIRIPETICLKRIKKKSEKCKHCLKRKGILKKYDNKNLK